MIWKWGPWTLAGMLALAVALAIPASWAQSRASGEGSGGSTLLVFAATSLAGALEPEAARFQKQTGTRLRIAYASSSLAARQIAFGAQADLFISAHQRWIDYLGSAKLLDLASQTALFSNALVLASARPGAAPLDLKPGVAIAPLLDAGLLAMGDPDHVPLGIYGKSALEWLGAWGALRQRIARADNARAALRMVERGETALGVVYLSDARKAGLTIVGTFPKASHAAIIYSAAIVSKAKNLNAARRFIAYLTTPAVSARFAAMGYLPLPGDSQK